MSKPQWVYSAMLRTEKRGHILEQLPKDVQDIWKEYRNLGHTNYHVTKIEKVIYYLFSICIKVMLFLKGRKVEVKEIYSDFLTSIENTNKKIEEFIQKAEVKLVLKLFNENNVAWSELD